MASVVINTRINNRKAEADLKELQAKAKETAREINAVEKGLGSATTKRNKLRDDLEAARQKACCLLYTSPPQCDPRIPAHTRRGCR